MCLAQGHLDTHLGGAGHRTCNLPVTSHADPLYIAYTQPLDYLLHFLFMTCYITYRLHIDYHIYTYTICVWGGRVITSPLPIIEPTYVMTGKIPRLCSQASGNELMSTPYWPSNTANGTKWSPITASIVTQLVMELTLVCYLYITYNICTYLYIKYYIIYIKYAKIFLYITLRLHRHYI